MKKREYTYKELLLLVIRHIEDEFGGITAFIGNSTAEELGGLSTSSLYTVLAKPKEGAEPSTKSIRLIILLAKRFWGIELSKKIIMTRSVTIVSEDESKLDSLLVGYKSSKRRGNVIVKKDKD